MLRDVYFDLGDFDSGLNLQRRTLRQHPRDPMLLNMLAWDLATLPGERFRSGGEAIELAKRACDETRWKNWQYIDTYAAAAAENRQWELAVRWQAEAIAMATSKSETPEMLADLQRKLALFRAHKSYHDPVASGWSRRFLQRVSF